MHLVFHGETARLLAFSCSWDDRCIAARPREKSMRNLLVSLAMHRSVKATRIAAGFEIAMQNAEKLFPTNFIIDATTT